MMVYLHDQWRKFPFIYLSQIFPFLLKSTFWSTPFPLILYILFIVTGDQQIFLSINPLCARISAKNTCVCFAQPNTIYSIFTFSFILIYTWAIYYCAFVHKLECSFFQFPSTLVAQKCAVHALKRWRWDWARGVIYWTSSERKLGLPMKVERHGGELIIDFVCLLAVLPSVWNSHGQHCLAWLRPADLNYIHRLHKKRVYVNIIRLFSSRWHHWK